MKAFRILSALLVILCFSILPALAQGPPPPSGGGTTSGPIDGGAIALLAGVAFYGYKRLKEDNKNKGE